MLVDYDDAGLDRRLLYSQSGVFAGESSQLRVS